MKKILLLIILFIITFSFSRDRFANIGISINPLHLTKQVYTVELDLFYSILGMSGTYLYFDEDSEDYFLDLKGFLHIPITDTWLPPPFLIYFGGGGAFTIAELKNNFSQSSLEMIRFFVSAALHLDLTYFFIKLRGNFEGVYQIREENSSSQEAIYQSLESGKLSTRKAVRTFREITPISKKRFFPTLDILVGFRL